MSESIKKLLEKCVNLYEHCGEFEFYGNTIKVFRRCGYEDFDTSKYIEGDESVVAIVNDEYFAGWYSYGEDDLKNAMSDAIQWILENKDVTLDFELTGITNIATLKKRQEIANRIFEDLQNIVEYYFGKGYVQSLTLSSVDIDHRYNEAKFVAKVSGGWPMYKMILENFSILDEDYYFHNHDWNIQKLSIDFLMSDDKDQYNEMFTTRMSWY
jgi:hypothetical protein